MPAPENAARPSKFSDLVMSPLDELDSVISYLQFGLKLSPGDVEMVHETLRKFPQDAPPPTIIDARVENNGRRLKDLVTRGYIEGCFSDQSTFTDDSFCDFVSTVAGLAELAPVGVISSTPEGIRYSLLVLPYST